MVRNFYRGDADPDFDPPVEPNCDENVTNEFYRISENDPFLIDLAKLDLMKLEPVLTPHQLAHYIDLTGQLQNTLTSDPPCIGDGNIDGVVDSKDLLDWKFFSLLTMEVPDGGSSWYDINQNGPTDDYDRDIIVARQGTDCSDL